MHQFDWIERANHSQIMSRDSYAYTRSHTSTMAVRLLSFLLNFQINLTYKLLIIRKITLTK